MTKYVSFGIITTKMIIPFSLAFSQIIVDIVDYLYSNASEYCDEENECKKESNAIMNSYPIALGAIIVIIIPHIKKFSIKYEQNKTEENLSKKQMFCKYFLLIIIYILLMSSIIFSSSSDSKEEVISPHLYGLCMKEGFEIIFLTIITYFALKYKYFIHNIISLIFFIVVCLSIDLILNSIQNDIKNVKQFILEYIINVILEAVLLIYEKYIIEKFYFSPWTICCVNGTVLFVVNSFTLIYVLSKGKSKSDEEMSFIKGFYDYFDRIKTSIIISQFIISFILQIIFNIFKFLTIYYFSINHILISYSLSKMATILIRHESNKEFYCIILFVLQFLLLMIYLEVIELHFWGLDKNTRRNILLREREDMDFIQDKNRESLIEISPGYMISIEEYEKMTNSLQKKNTNKDFNKIENNNKDLELVNNIEPINIK